MYTRNKSIFGNIHKSKIDEMLFVSMFPTVKSSNFITGTTIKKSLINKIIKAIKDIYIDFCQLKPFNIILNSIIQKKNNNKVCVPKGIFKNLYICLEKISPTPKIIVNKIFCTAVDL